MGDDPGLFPAPPPARLRRARPMPTSGRPSYTALKYSSPGQALIQCDACMQIAHDAQVQWPRGGNEYPPPIRLAHTVRRTGRCSILCRDNLRRRGIGCEHARYLCAQHAADQRQIDSS